MSIIKKVFIITLSLLLGGIQILLAHNNIDALHGVRINRKQGLHNGNIVET
ncbi:MAG: hypothetical protein HQ556_03570, partial [Candidatus Marinimicrobia bacterium]|nr:hypothetical protein [Candidatus Neomarinimicrobiota bacterium]